MATAPQKVTLDEANLALQQLSGIETGEEETPQETPAQEPTSAPPREATAAPEPTQEAAPEESAAAPVEAAAETDDVQSLRKRLETVDEERKRDREEFDKRVRAMQERHQQNERILRDRHLRKSSIADKALRTLKAVRTEAGVPEAEVDRVISELQGTMNPDSASYAPPPESYAQAREEQAVVLNSFLNEKGMTGEEAAQFGKWVQGEAANVLTQQELDVAEKSLDGFLRLAHTRWQTGLRETEAANQKKQADAAAAVKAAQRIQKDAARASSAPASSPKRQPAQPKGLDTRKLTKDEVSELLRQSVLHAND